MVVVGGGLAGLTAALDLAEAGAEPLLIERRPFVGGKTYSFVDRASGVELDNGQHVHLRCCTEYLALIDRLGLGDHVHMQPRLRVPVLDPAGGRRSVIGAGPTWAPPPLHLAPALLRYQLLGWRDKLRLGRAMFAIQRLGDTGRRQLDALSFGDWLRAHGQRNTIIKRFWDVVVLPTCNDASEHVSARQAIMVIQTALLRDAHAGDLGYATVGLSHIADAVLEAVRAGGGRARLGTAITGLDHEGDQVSGVLLPRGERIAARAVILALPPNRIAPLLPPAWRAHPALTALGELRYAPIVNVHVHLDQPVLDDEFVAVLDPTVQYVFNRSRIQSLPGPGQWLTCSLSGAHDQNSQPREAVAAAAIAGLRRAFLDARTATVLRAHVVKEPEATFRPLPGVAVLRLGAETPYPNLFLAGAWTDTEWPATMESAVHSGHRAAQAWLARGD